MKKEIRLVRREWRFKMEEIVRQPWNEDLPGLVVADLVQALGYISGLERRVAKLESSIRRFEERMGVDIGA